jgi:hypothetical protein
MGTHLVVRTAPAASLRHTPHAGPTAHHGPSETRFADLLGARPPSPPAGAPRGAPVPNGPPPIAAPPPPDPLLETGHRWLSRVARGERELERMVRDASSQTAVSPADLLLIQAQVYRHTQQVELFSKLVDRASSGVRTVLQQGG